jgi:hypothetical protein
MTTIDAQPVKDLTAQWGVMDNLSASTSAVLTRGGKHFRLWSRLQGSIYQFIALPVEQEPVDDFYAVAHTTVHEALLDVLVQTVKNYALLNYQNGWDVIVECWEDADIREAIGQHTTIAEAIRAVQAIVHLHEGRRWEIEAEIL